MNIRRIIAPILILLVVVSCTTSSLSRREINKLAAEMDYVVIPANVFGTEKDIKVHYEEVGNPDAPAMILLHGFSVSTITWRKCMPELGKSFHVFALDMPGFGFSDKYPDFPYEAEGYGRTIVEFMDRKGIDKAIIGGNAMGGGISVWMAIYRPELVSGLILVDSAGYPMEKLPGMFSLLTKPSMKPIVKALWGKSLIKAGMKSIYYDDSMITKEDVELWGRPLKTENGKDVLFWSFARFDMDEVREESKKIPSIKVPTLIIWGENDEILPVEQARMFHRDIAGSKLIIIPKCGHTPQEEKPEIVTSAILDFFQQDH